MWSLLLRGEGEDEGIIFNIGPSRTGIYGAADPPSIGQSRLAIVVRLAPILVEPKSM